MVKDPMKKGSFVPKNVPGVGVIQRLGGVGHTKVGVRSVMQGWEGVGWFM